MGTMIQRYGLSEEDYRGERFEDHPRTRATTTCSRLTQPQMIHEIHGRYLEAGADIVETNTFNATAISQADYGLEDLAWSSTARPHGSPARRRTPTRRPERPRLVAGALGPTNRTASLSPDVNNPGSRNVTFDELAAAYKEAARGLVEGGADLLLVETIFDTLNAKAAIFGIKEYLEEEASRSRHDLRHDHRRERAHALGPGD